MTRHIESGDSSGADLNFPTRILFNERKKAAFVLDNRKSNVCILDAESGIFTGSVGREGQSPGHFQNPVGFAVDKRGHFLYVADTGNDRVQVLENASGSAYKFLRFIGGRLEQARTGVVVQQSELNQPEDVAVSPNGDLVAVADTGNNRIRLYSHRGERIRIIGMMGKQKGQFNLPASVIFHGPTNNIIVADNRNDRIQVFSPDGRFIRAVKYVKGPSAISSNDQYFFVTEEKTNSIVILQ